MEKTVKSNLFYIDEIIRLSVGMIIRRFGKENSTKVIFAEHEVDGCKECFLQSVVKKLLKKCPGRKIIKHDTLKEAIDVTVPEFFGNDMAVA